MDSYITVRRAASFEYEDRKSRFIARCTPVESEAEALSFIDSVRRAFPDATHHVYAYSIKENSITRFTDDREPQGTAGMPVLDIIRKNNCTNVAIVVVRYFGGTLLGTGGLVRAYSGAALGALKAAELITYDLYAIYSLECSYSDYQKLGTIFESTGFRQEDTEYYESIRIGGSIRASDAEDFEDKLVQATGGRIKIKKIDEKFDF
ncbi:MAG: YigZ family protein [Clostridia bacterium]|nr:YigZ family protein [Clostridia bacterium]